jgi:hypothetical protein
MCAIIEKLRMFESLMVHTSKESLFTRKDLLFPQPTTRFDNPVRKGGFHVVYVRYYRKIADV